MSAISGWAQPQPEEVASPEAQELIKQLNVKDLSARQRAFIHLEALREPATAGVVRQHLESRDYNTRAFSVRALAAIEGVQAIPLLLERLKRDRSPYVRLSAILALEPFHDQDPAIASAFMAALRDRKPEVRMTAVDAVSRLSQPEAREAILTRWRRQRERNRDVRRVLEQAMDRLGEPR